MRTLIDRIIVCLIAAVQLLWSGYALLYVVIGHFPEGLIAYFAWGFIAAVALFTGKAFPRILAVLWQAVLLTYFFMQANGPWDAFTSGLWAIPVTVYLAVTAIFRFQHKKPDLAQ